MTSNTLESFVSGLEPLLIALIAVCVLVGCVAAMKILKGDVYHSVPWFPWVVPIVSWLAAAVCGYLVLF